MTDNKDTLNIDIATKMVRSVTTTAETLRHECNVLLNSIGLSDSQFRILRLLADTPDGLSQIRLSEILSVHRSHITGMIERMERAGWIARASRSDDRRVKTVTLTPAGRKLAHQGEEIYRVYMQRIADAFSPKDQAALNELLTRLCNHLHI